MILLEIGRSGLLHHVCQKEQDKGTDEPQANSILWLKYGRWDRRTGNINPVKDKLQHFHLQNIPTECKH